MLLKNNLDDICGLSLEKFQTRRQKFRPRNVLELLFQLKLKSAEEE